MDAEFGNLNTMNVPTCACYNTNGGEKKMSIKWE